MKNILLLLSIICICFQSISQNECSEEIPNGSFENWKDNSPINWATTNIADKIADMQGVNYDFKNISQSPGFKGSALHLKNVSLADFYEQMNPEA